MSKRTVKTYKGFPVSNPGVADRFLCREIAFLLFQGCQDAQAASMDPYLFVVLRNGSISAQLSHFFQASLLSISSNPAAPICSNRRVRLRTC